MRARVYCLLSFKDKDCLSLIRPRYDLSVEDACTDVARTILWNSRHLDIFGIVLGDQPRDHGYRFLSWVPYWTLSLLYSRPIAFSDIKSSFRASQDCCHTPKADPVPSRLTVRGHIVGSVSKIVPCSFDSGYYMDSIKDILRVEAITAWVKNCLESSSLQYDTQEGRTNLAVSIFQTLLVDSAFGENQPIPENIDELIGAYLDEKEITSVPAQPDSTSKAAEDGVGESATKSPQNLLRKVRGYSLVVQRKRVFISDRNHLGLAPLTIREEDLIFIIHGSKTPCVLRRPEGEYKDNEYRLISQCYLDGWMYGDNPEPVNKWWEAEPEEFVLV
jgi:hypothetical protein